MSFIVHIHPKHIIADIFLDDNSKPFNGVDNGPFNTE